MNKYYLFIALIGMIACDPGLPSGDGNEGVLIVKRTADFEVNGRGDASHWNQTEWLDLPQRTERPVTYETRVKVLYSDTGIYFLFDCEDRILTTTMEADNLNLWEEDVVEVFLWPQEDFPVYFEYELSPMNYELPIIVPNYNGKFLGWLPWKYEGDKRARRATSVRGGRKESGAVVTGWMAEFFIPYKLLEPLPNVPPGPGTRWRANLYRLDHDQGLTRFSWQETERSFHEYDRFGTFIFE
jgi:hypothetical protein